MRTFMTALLGGFLLICAAGCNTIRGAGEDIENTGQNVKEAVTDP